MWPVTQFFSVSWHPLSTLDLPRALLPELQRSKDTGRCGALGAEVPGHRRQQLTQTLIVRLLKTHLFTPILDWEKSTDQNFGQTCWPSALSRPTTSPKLVRSTSGTESGPSSPYSRPPHMSRVVAIHPGHTHRQTSQLIGKFCVFFGSLFVHQVQTI